MKSYPHFEVLARSGNARLGQLRTNHGVIETPAFMPVGTIGTVKALDQVDLANAGATVMLSNTYHLFLRPGPEMIARRGGLHKFISTSLPILTDSGGYQVMSLSKFRKITDEGVHFKSHLDGHPLFLSPEEAARIQNVLGSDIQMVFDVCPGADADEAEVRRATHLSHLWARRAVEYEKPPGILRFGIAQGGMIPALRAESTATITSMPFDGVAVGGLSVGEPEEVMMEMLDVSAPHLPHDRPRYLMGVGKPSQILSAVKKGIDLFDCVLPTRIARHGTLWTSEGILRINRAEFTEDDGPLDPACRCLACTRYSRAYLRHMYRVEEPLYMRLASLHNITYLLNFMEGIRAIIRDGRSLDEYPASI